MPAPKTPKEVKQFLGLVGYYRKFVPRFTDISRVLTHLTKKHVEFKWTAECENCFQILKKTLKESPILRYPDPEANYTLYTDASKYAYCRSLNTRHRRNRPPHHVCKQTLQGLTVKLGYPDQRSLCYLHVNQETKFLHRYSKGYSEK